MPNDLASELAELRRRVHDLEVTARANKTSVRDGFMQFLPGSGDASLRIGSDDPDGNVTLTVVDTNGRDAIVIGTASDGTAFVRVLNPDGSGPSFEVNSGKGIFPPAVAPWVINHALTVQAQGRPTHDGASYAPMLFCALPLTDPTVDLGIFGATLSAGTCDWTLTAETLNARDGHVAQSGVVVASNLGYSGSGSPFPSPVTIPTSVWDPAASPVGALVLLRINCRVVSGGGTATIYAATGARCL